MAWGRRKKNPFDREIHEAILLACEDAEAADADLESIRERAAAANDRTALVACLKVLSVTGSMTGREDGRWIERCRELVALDPDNPSGWVQLGHAEEAVGNQPEAIAAWEAALERTLDERLAQLLRAQLDRVRPPPVPR